MDTIFKEEKPLGYWLLGRETDMYTARIAIYYKPTPQQIKNTEELLGWKWVEVEVS